MPTRLELHRLSERLLTQREELRGERDKLAKENLQLRMQTAPAFTREEASAGADKCCGANGYICPMCVSEHCPYCAHANDDHVAKDGLDPWVLTCAGLFVDPITGAESFCDCVQVVVP